MIEAPAGMRYAIAGLAGGVLKELKLIDQCLTTTVVIL
jgi:hypothetical protein